MSQRKPAPTPKRRVWRISESAPLGEYVDPDAPSREAREARAQTLAEVAVTTGWAVSSYELRHGADITEGPDTVPADLFDELFAPDPEAPKAP